MYQLFLFDQKLVWLTLFTILKLKEGLGSANYLECSNLVGYFDDIFPKYLTSKFVIIIVIIFKINKLPTLFYPYQSALFKLCTENFFLTAQFLLVDKENFCIIHLALNIHILCQKLLLKLLHYNISNFVETRFWVSVSLADGPLTLTLTFPFILLVLNQEKKFSVSSFPTRCWIMLEFCLGIKSMKTAWEMLLQSSPNIKTFK